MKNLNINYNHLFIMSYKHATQGIEQNNGECYVMFHPLVNNTAVVVKSIMFFNL